MSTRDEARWSAARLLTTASSGGPPIISALTGIRAVAALWVVVFHLQEPLLSLLPALRPLEPWTSTGFLGVDVFFVLSGFIISHNYADRLAVQDRRERRNFLLARFARLYPVHLATFLMSAALVGAFAAIGATMNPTQHYTLVGFVGNVVVLQGLPGLVAWNGASWSITCEAAAYLVFPFAAGALLRAGRRGALLLAVVVGAATVVALMLLSTASAPETAINWVRITGEFTVGATVWALWRRGTQPHRRWDLVALFSFGAAVLVLWLAGTSEYFWLAVPFLALFVVAVASSAGAVRTVLSHPWMQWGGRVSYSLYLVHPPVLMVLFMLLKHWELTDRSLIVRFGVLVIYGVGAVASAAVVYHLVEEPGRLWLRRRFAPSSDERLAERR